MSELSVDIRSFLSQIGLREGASEEEVLKQFKGKKLPKDDDDQPLPEEMIDEDVKAPKKSKKAAVAPTPTRPGQLVPPTNGKKDKQAATNKNANNASSKANANAATTTPVISLSRPPKVKPEPVARGKGVKSESAADAAAPSESAPTSRPDPTTAFPLNKPSLPSAPAPSTLPKEVNTAGMKWWQQASHVVLPFPKDATKTTKQSQGKKVSLVDGNDKSAHASTFIPPATVDDCFTLASERFTSILGHFDAVNSGRTSDARWLSTVMQSGTLTDKIAGMTLMIQESPLYRLPILDKLLAMAHKQGRRENTMAIDALKDLFMNDLLPPRKLLSFASQPFFKGTGPSPSETQLVYWYLEDALKTRYLDFLGILEAGTHDEMAYVKKARVGCIYELLLACPERERVLLSLLVNKLGDSDKKVASKVVYYLTELVLKHPGFKLTLISELEQLLYRENISKRAQYYAIIFLNQMVFTQGETELANKLIHVYFLLFKQFIAMNKKEREEEEAKMKKKQIRKKQRELKKSGLDTSIDIKPAPKSYGGSNSVSKKFELKKAAISLEASDALRSKLLGGLLTGINRALPYASVSALDGSGSTTGTKSGEELVHQQMDMIFNIVHTTSFNTSIQALMLLYQALSRSILAGTTSGPNIDRFYRALYDKLLAPELLQSGAKYGLFLNLIYKALKADTNLDRISAFIKRLLQIAQQSQPNFVCGILYLLSTIFQHHKGLQLLITQPQARVKLVTGKDGKVQKLEEDDEDEHFTDAPEEETEEEKKLKGDTATKKGTKDDIDATVQAGGVVKDVYDPFHRSPEYAHARSSCVWELLLFLNHFHPSVRKFATDVMHGTPIQYAGDPLRDFTNANFLDRFVYKNPKAKSSNASQTKITKAFAPPNLIAKVEQVNTPAFLAKSTEQVDDELQFFHKYFTTKAASDALKAKARPNVDMTEEEEDAFADDLIEREMKKMDPDSWMDDPDMDDMPEEDDEDGEGEDGVEMDGEFGEEDGEFDESMMDEDADMPMGDGDEDIDEDADEAAALAEMEAGGAPSDEDEDEEDEEDEFTFDDDDDEDEEDDESASGSRDRNASVFASAEEFADLLNQANDTGKSRKQSAWEKRSSLEESRDQPKGRSKSSSIGYQSAPAPGRSGKKSVSKKQGGGAAAEKPSFKALKRKHMESQGKSNKKGGKRPTKKRKH